MHAFRRRLLAVSAAAGAVFALGVGQAGALMPGGGGGPIGPHPQMTGQHAITVQHAESKARSTQFLPLNVNIPLQVLSLGENGGHTSQSNNSAAWSHASNKAHTSQDMTTAKPEGHKPEGHEPQRPEGHKPGCDQPHQAPDQGPKGDWHKPEGPKGDWHKPAPAPASSQKAVTDQDASSKAESTQIVPVNVNAPIQVLSLGHNGGDTAQSNNSAAVSGAKNESGTQQAAATAPAAQADGGKSFGHFQPAPKAPEQVAVTDQDASSKAESTQVVPVNVNAPIQVLSLGHNGGDTAQSNNSAAGSFAGNQASTSQVALPLGL
jgi:hypothetical protein